MDRTSNYRSDHLQAQRQSERLKDMALEPNQNLESCIEDSYLLRNFGYFVHKKHGFDNFDLMLTWLIDNICPNL
ncbi:hypothetical protein BpHYR1_001008 [Brachionus plicatilis]|uniref:Uncharacterized protein n=1 Tax=Brachionus plicatilis TaxID=10195 RepID=A0A3M7PBA2_BRAPC|nr:hypothetical protein BpHYR1_001008 [Brachionus plicatilis]